MFQLIVVSDPTDIEQKRQVLAKLDPFLKQTQIQPFLSIDLLSTFILAKKSLELLAGCSKTCLLSLLTLQLMSDNNCYILLSQ